MDVKALLKSLSEACGVSGYEDEVRGVIRQAFEPYCDEIRVDTMGNLIGLKKGSGKGGARRKRVMLAGHMDEIGLMVTEIDQGFIRFTQVGGYDTRVLPAQAVTVFGRERLPGIIASVPPHVSGSSDKSTPMDELYVDVGLSESQVNKLARVGDLITLDRPCVELSDDLLCGKAFDDRASVAAIVTCLEILSQTAHEWDVYAVATVQEEVGLRGATTGAFGIAPDLGIAIDVGFGKQPGVKEKFAIILGKGPALARGPNIHPKLFAGLKATAEKFEIPYQVEVTSGGTGTDANAIQLTRDGIPTGLISIPERNMHTPVETISIKDVERTGRLLACYIAGLDADTMGQFVWDDDNGGEK
ncbi:MAG: M42 family metallopeptidase [Lentisphaeria bacterium]|nr:M42 family metallopeptidase [Lentisphaeria bacterium]